MQEAPPPRPKAYPGIAQTFGLLALLYALILPIMMIWTFAAGTEEGEFDLWSLVVGNTLGFSAVIAIGSRRARREGRDALRLCAFDPRTLLPVILASVSGVLLAGTGLNYLFERIPFPDWLQEVIDRVNDLLVTGIQESFLAAVLATVVVAPLTEELFFRGVVLRGFEHRYGSRIAIIVSSIFFGIAHGIPTQAVYAFLLGLFLAWVALRSGSLWPSILAHAVSNGASVMAARLAPEYTGDAANSEAPPLPVLVMSALILVSSLAWLDKVFRSRQRLPL